MFFYLKAGFLLLFSAVLICGAGGCSSAPGLMLPVTLPEYRKRYPKADLERLKGKTYLSLRTAQALALANNPDYHAAYQAVAAAKFRYYQSLSSYLPYLSWNTQTGQSLANHDNLKNPPEGIVSREYAFSAGNSLNASFLLFDGFEREFSALIAQSGFRKTRFADSNVRRLLMRAVAYAYFDAILAREKERIAMANMEFQTSSLLQAENRYQNGFVSKAAVLNFKILAAMAKSDLLNARYQGEVARYALMALMGFSTEELPETLRLDPLFLRDFQLDFSEEYYLNEALANRPDLKEFKELLVIARYRKYAAYSQFLPVISAYAETIFGTHSSRYGDAENKHSYYNEAVFDYGIRATWSLFSGFSTYNLVKERLMLERVASFQLENSFLTIVNEVKSACANYRNAVWQVAIFQDMLSWVREQRQLVAVAYWAGNETITRFNGAQNDFVSAEAKLAISLVELKKAEAQLRAAVNLPFREDILRVYPEADSGTPLETLLNRLDRQYP